MRWEVSLHDENKKELVHPGYERVVLDHDPRTTKEKLIFHFTERTIGLVVANFCLWRNGLLHIYGPIIPMAIRNEFETIQLQLYGATNMADVLSDFVAKYKDTDNEELSEVAKAIEDLVKNQALQVRAINEAAANDIPGQPTDDE